MPDQAARIAVICLESTAPGTAPGYHLTGTLRRLEVVGVRDPMVVADDSGRSRARRLARLLRRSWGAAHHHDVVVMRWHLLAAVALLPWRVAGRRIVLLVPGVPSDVFSSHGWLRPFGRLLTTSSVASWRWADAIVASHAGIARQIAQVAPGLRATVGVAPNGPPPVVAALPDVHRERRYVVFAGSLARWQGLPLMLEALAHPEWPEEVDLVVIGDGAETQRLQTATDQRLVWMGRLDPSRTQAHLRGALASLSVKTFGPATEHGISPFKVAEAHALGVPVVATDLPGQGDYLRAQGGGLIIGQDPAELARAVRTLLDPGIREPLVEQARAAGARNGWERDAGVLAEAVGMPQRRASAR
ncbi:glycosyltransferase family 4 protein [Ornithinimicrobium cerasi]|uniref:glycosyltransferase family 4 protein n=1 Tax=Ornithinimicrobium cerasi TaxID=2248773 RepID=UPI001379ADA4|nr:glycosyltransferase family 4 protein [Ornithinimicrobium cerasi]